MSNLLVVDWDYFFPIIERDEESTEEEHWMLYDWGHKESLFHIRDIWPIRAESFLRRGLDLPGTSGEENDFWRQFNFPWGVELFVAESNAMAASTAITDSLTRYGNEVEEVWLFDAHHDAGYRQGIDLQATLEEGRYSCEDWMLLYWGLGANLNVRYPSWRHYAMDMEPEPAVDVDRDVADPVDGWPDDVEFDTVFVCRSGAWTPPWLDKSLVNFIERCPAKITHDLDMDAEHGLSALKPRGFDVETAVQMAADHSKLMMVQEVQDA